MKYILIFWLAQGQPVATPMANAYACVQGLRIIQGELPKTEGVCLPEGGDVKTYGHLLSDANSKFQGQ